MIVVFPDHTHLYFCVNVKNVINLRILFERMKTEDYGIIDLLVWWSNLIFSDMGGRLVNGCRQCYSACPMSE